MMAKQKPFRCEIFTRNVTVSQLFKTSPYRDVAQLFRQSWHDSVCAYEPSHSPCFRVALFMCFIFPLVIPDYSV